MGNGTNTRDYSYRPVAIPIRRRPSLSHDHYRQTMYQRTPDTYTPTRWAVYKKSKHRRGCRHIDHPIRTPDAPP